MRAKSELRRSVAGSGGGVRAKSEFPVSSGAERLVLAPSCFSLGLERLVPSLADFVRAHDIGNRVTTRLRVLGGAAAPPPLAFVDPCSAAI